MGWDDNGSQKILHLKLKFVILSPVQGWICFLKTELLSSFVKYIVFPRRALLRTNILTVATRKGCLLLYSYIFVIVIYLFIEILILHYIFGQFRAWKEIHLPRKAFSTFFWQGLELGMNTSNRGKKNNKMKTKRPRTYCIMIFLEIENSFNKQKLCSSLHAEVDMIPSLTDWKG